MTRKIKGATPDELAPVDAKARTQLVRLAAGLMQPQPLKRPEVDSALAKLSAVPRAAETLRYSLLRAEYWLSPRGRLREYFRLNLRLALYLGIPAVLLTPIVTLVLTNAVTWSAKLVEIARNLALVPAWLGTGLLVLTGLAFLRRLIFGR